MGQAEPPTVDIGWCRKCNDGLISEWRERQKILREHKESEEEESTEERTTLDESLQCAETG